jgi:signal transduction histidine kinase
MQQKRRQIIVNPKVQYKLLLLILISVLIPTLLTFLSLFFLIQSLVVEAQIDNEVVYSALMFLNHKVFAILLIGFVCITVLLISWSLLFIHRIVGPLFRLEKELDKMISGKKIAKIRFRKYDSFKSLAEKFNILIDRLQDNS